MIERNRSGSLRGGTGIWRGLFATVAAGAALLLAGCSEKPPEDTLTVLAGSELKDLGPLLPKVREKTGVQLQFTYAGTLDIVEGVAGGRQTDLVWVSHGKYLQLTPGARERIKAAEKTMLSPVVLGLRESKGRELGWCGSADVTWADIAKAAQEGRFTFGMTNPANSNSGFTALVGLAAALSGNPDALTAEAASNPRLAAFFKAQRLTSGSSGWLADAYVKEPKRVDGIINYESVLLSLNAEGKLPEKLCLVYPKEGIVSADYPLMLLDDGKRAAYARLADYLRSDEFQREMTAHTLRRPVNPAVQPDAAIPRATLVELPFPGSLDVIDALLAAFLGQVRLPSHSWFVLDTSGSMEGKGMEQLKAALAALAGADSSVSGRYARFQNREQVSVVRFAQRPERTVDFDMGSGAAANEAMLQQLRSYASALKAFGGTAIYDALVQALGEAQKARSKDAGRYYTVVLMTDGQNTAGRNFEAFRQWYEALPEGQRGIRVFPVAFGSADMAELEKLAELTGGRAFDGRKGDLSAVFKEIRGYQ